MAPVLIVERRCVWMENVPTMLLPAVSKNAYFSNLFNLCFAACQKLCNDGSCVQTREACPGWFLASIFYFSDSFYVPDECRLFEFKCLSGATRCVSASFKCDGDNDCDDGSDEFGCTSESFVLGVY
eukprot:GHVO01041638.1.p1 GENE.GHVO01041638.1~~GHVO01041638.1.p1  ORF type:complete len:126 (+),score=3.31 GHVO01041638.1:110-487(+)